MHHPHTSLKKMQETTLHSSPSFPKHHHPFPKHPHSYSSSFPKLPLPILRSSLRSPPTITQKPPPLTSPHFHSTPPHLREKLLFLDSVGLDHLSLIQSHPSISTAPLSDIKSTVHFLSSLSLTSPDLRRILGICPQILTSDPQTLTSIVTFLLREAGVDFLHLRHVIHRRPRLLLSDVATRLRPTLYFLQMLGISPISRHTYLLSCSVEEKLIPRLDFLQDSGFTPKEARLMVRRFPAMFCYGIEGNLARKLGFLVEEMGRGLGEVREFPQYFSYSLERRIRKRHLVCEAKRVMFTLPALLRPSDEEFRERVEVCVGSSPPLRGSPLCIEYTTILDVVICCQGPCAYLLDFVHSFTDAGNTFLISYFSWAAGFSHDIWIWQLNCIHVLWSAGCCVPHVLPNCQDIVLEPSARADRLGLVFAF